VANDQVRIITPKHPVGRLVGGSVSQARDKDMDGNPYIIKNGPKAGQPTVKYYIAVAIPKRAGQTHWSVKPADWNDAVEGAYWGEQIWKVGHAAFPGIAQNPSFAWKIDDGDSAIPNTKGKKHSDNPNLAGCWILHCSNFLPIKACNDTGSSEIDPEDIKCGYYVQVAIMVQGNKSSQKPGIYLNPLAVSLQFRGPEILQGLDTAKLGFGGAVMPPNGSSVPNLMNPAPTPTAPAPAPAYVAPTASYTAPTASYTAPAPNTAILGGVAAPAPAAPPAPVAAAPTGPQPTAKAAGATLAQMLAWPGWTLDTLKQNGYVS
jgi:hypothetical protein